MTTSFKLGEGAEKFICPYCRTPFKVGDEAVSCPACETLHHASCWEENKGCTIFGCSEQHYEEQGTNPTDVCSNCGSVLGDGQEFCPKCGTPKSGMKKNVCGKCGAKLQDGQEFCSQCGQKAGLAVEADVSSAISHFNAGVVNKKKKSKVLPIVLVIILLIGTIGGYFIYSTIQEKNRLEAIKSYISDAKMFCSKVLSSASDMEKIGNKIQSNWYTYIYNNGKYIKKFSSIEDAVYSAQKDQSSNIVSVKSDKTQIDSLYTTLLKIPKNSDLSEIKEAIKDLYDTYEDMYDCVINPTGNYNQFTSEFSDCDTNVVKRVNALSKLLKAIE